MDMTLFSLGIIGVSLWFWLGKRDVGALVKDKPSILSTPFNVKWEVGELVPKIVEYASKLRYRPAHVDDTHLIFHKNGPFGFMLIVYLLPIKGGTKLEIGIASRIVGAGTRTLFDEELKLFVNGLRIDLRPAVVSTTAFPVLVTLADELAKLSTLKTNGSLSEEEFQAAKAQIIKKAS